MSDISSGWRVCHCDWRRQGKRRVRRGKPCALHANEPAGSTKRRPSYAMRFQPFVTFQPDPRDLADAGLSHLQIPREKGGGVAFNSERDLNRYLASGKDHGRPVAWKEH